MEIICSYDNPDIIAGHGTMGLEIVGQVPGLDAVLVPVGGGGLIAGVAVAVKSLYPDVLVYVSYALVITKIRRPFDARSTACHQRSLRSL